ncbi:uncharacterized protein [Periplaneta americana]|uniref:uncharacterized protein n=1 Tax=Periplaneta americana TaxID=6978 RepID=UPI0037E798C0
MAAFGSAVKKPGHGLALHPTTQLFVRVRDGYSQTLQTYVELDENNLSFFGQGNGNIGDFDQVDRFQSGFFLVKGFDAWNMRRCNWSVIVQVVPEYVSMDTANLTSTMKTHIK